MQAPAAMAALEAFRIPPAAASEWSAFLDVFRTLRAATADWPAELDLVARWYEPHLFRLYDDAAVRQRDLLQLHQIASTYSSRERFLTDMALDPPAATSDEAGVPGKDDDYLILSTIHSAKGQEWKAVHILNVVDGCIPSDMGTGTTEEVEEERRLLYVAMTRAKDDLQLFVPQRFYVHQQASVWRSACLRFAQPLHSRCADGPLRRHRLAAGAGGGGAARFVRGRARRPRRARSGCVGMKATVSLTRSGHKGSVRTHEASTVAGGRVGLCN